MSEAGSYATVQDLFTFSIAVDDAQSYAPPVVEQWLRLGANKINEWLGQRFTLPLSSFSLSIVWANCELAYIGLAKIRGFNTDSDVQALTAREKAVNEWMRLTRDHEITPDKSLVIAESPYQPIRYIGPTLPSWGGSPDGGGGGWSSGNAW
jgi:phage gp36-like protein